MKERNRTVRDRERKIAIGIDTTSSTLYSEAPHTAIYPAFVDNLPYEAWTRHGCTPYFQLRAAGGYHHYHWSLVSGALPEGLALSQDGKISGVATCAGCCEFTVRTTDNRGRSADKTLLMEALPYRSKWFKDAKFGIFVQWGSFSFPSISDTQDIAALEKRIVNFDAEQWAQAVADLGGSVFNFTIMHNDNVRLWPSRGPTVFGLQTSRDIVGELIEACHKRGIRFIAYLPGDGGYVGSYDLSGIDRTCATLHYDLIAELLDKGIDGIWIDSGGSAGRADWFDWERVIPLVRSRNPLATIQANTAPGSRGKILQYPHADIVTYEGLQCETADLLSVCIPNTTRKTMAIDVVNMLDYYWTWSEDSPRAIKPAAEVIRNIQLNWYNGGTYMLNITPHTDGTFVPEPYRPVLEQIGSWVKDNLDWCEAPVASLDDDIEYESALIVKLSAEEGAVIHYTLDGSIPDAESSHYDGCLPIETSTRVRAVAVMPGRGNSPILDRSYVIAAESPEGERSAILSLGASVTIRATGTVFTGVKFKVGKDPLLVRSIGRYYAVGNRGIHRIKLVRVNDLTPLVIVPLVMEADKVEYDGFLYKQIVPVRLEPYTSYYLVSEEDERELRLHASLATTAADTDALTIRHAVATDETGTDYAFVSPAFPGDDYAHVLNMKYTKAENREPDDNVARSADVFLQDNEGRLVQASSGVHVAEHAIDGDPRTMAVAGQEKWAWTLHADLGCEVSGIRRIEVGFAAGMYPTEYELLLSSDSIEWICVETGRDFAGDRLAAVFSALDARYVRVRSLKPDGPNQPGVQMAVTSLEIHTNNGEA